jgi:hypothetical protein
MNHCLVRQMTGYTLVFALALSASCAPSKSSSASSGSTPGALTNDRPWHVTFVDDACTLSGVGALASSGKCDQLGELNLEGRPEATSMGRDVAALRLYQGETAGGAVATLSTNAATYRLDPAHWGTLLSQLRTTLTAARVAEREARFVGAPACPTGQVVLEFDRCPGDGTVADVCGPPSSTCGAPIATGSACSHHGACSSRKCGFLSGVCE